MIIFICHHSFHTSILCQINRAFIDIRFHRRFRTIQCVANISIRTYSLKCNRIHSFFTIPTSLNTRSEIFTACIDISFPEKRKLFLQMRNKKFPVFISRLAPSHFCNGKQAGKCHIFKFLNSSNIFSPYISLNPYNMFSFFRSKCLWNRFVIIYLFQ